MDFKVVQKEIELQSRGWIPTFHDISREVMEIVEESGVKNGVCTVVSHHTTCSVMVQECSHDIDSFDLEYLQHDLLDIMRKMIPDFAEEHQYQMCIRDRNSDREISPMISLPVPAPALMMQEAPATCSERPRLGPNCISKEAAMALVV